jgi:hypothetical protein
MRLNYSSMLSVLQNYFVSKLSSSNNQNQLTSLTTKPRLESRTNPQSYLCETCHTEYDTLAAANDCHP